ncbi:hypothetical protein LTR08_002660 [Meristemomyces frigidus]|nr:hypothetical protein LTR08_002660 [Meristemomyces frigidus]
MATTGIESGVKDMTLGKEASLSDRFASVEYSDTDKTEMEQWLAHPPADNPERLAALNTHFSSRTTLLGSKPSTADIELYNKLVPVVKSWSDEQRTGEHGHHHILRWMDYVQSSPVFALEGQKVDIDTENVVFYPKPIDLKAEKERKKKEKAAAQAAAGADAAATAVGAPVPAAPASKDAQAENEKPSKKQQQKAKDSSDNTASSAAADLASFPTEKKQKKEKQPKPQKNAPAADKPLSPAMIDLRVGHILKAIQHPDADSLYVSTIACGDPEGTDNTSVHDDGQIVRTVCSGLNGLVPLEDMQGRKIIAVCNLKPVKMRGVLSAAMVLAASPRLAEGEVDNHAGPVELVNPPAEAAAGERVYFEGFEGEPEKVLNPKKKVWDYCQVGFTTTEGKEVGFEAQRVEQMGENGREGVALLRTKQGLCTVKSLTVASAAHETFADALFTKRTHSYSKKGLQTLVDITKIPSLAKRISNAVRLAKE